MEIRLSSCVIGGATDMEISWYSADEEIPGDDKVNITLYDDRRPDDTVPFICVNLKELHAAVEALWAERMNEKTRGEEQWKD